MGIRSTAKRWAHSDLARMPLLSLGFTALALLLLVLVLLSVPGPIKGMYWFSVANEASGHMSAGVLGWCMTDTANCTYAPLSDNPYLSTMIDTGEALTVRIMLPLACYWMIIVLVAWVVLTATTGMGYQIKDLDSITRHLYYAVAETCVLCISLFGNVLCWLAFGLGRTAYLSVRDGGGDPKSGHAMETTAVAATMSLLSLFFAGWGLHLRLKHAQQHWKEEAVMVRRRSMALMAAGVHPDAGGGQRGNNYVGVGGPRSSASSDAVAAAGFAEKNGSGRWSADAPEYASGPGAAGQRGSMVKVLDPEEVLDPALQREIELARRNSRRES